MGSMVGKHWRAAARRMAATSPVDMALPPNIGYANYHGVDPCKEYGKRIKAARGVAPLGLQIKASIHGVATSSLKWALWLAVSSVVTMPPVFAQNAVEPWVEYHKRVEGAEHIAALEEGFAGDSVSLYDGATTFSVADISVPGNSKLPVQLVRRVSIELQVRSLNPYDTRLGGAGNWDVDVPYMTATYPSPNAYQGSPGWQAQRCSGNSWWLVSSLPPPFWNSDVWSGTTIHIPGRGNARALALNASVPVPTSGGPYYRTTSARDVLDCIPMRSGLSGEGFRLTTTSGVHYYFDIGTTRVASEIKKWWSEAGQPRYLLRDQYYLLASKIQDRYGNWVQFQYNSSGHPTRIWSKDGREIDLAYSGSRLVSATSHGRTWQYQYDGAGNLTVVKLPDTSRWQYTYSGSLTPPMPPPGESFINARCAIPPSLIADEYTLTAKGPSGATASFHFENTRHYRSGVIVNECINIGEPLSPIWYLRTPYFFDVMSLTRKTISGSGIPTATWNYSYDASPAHLWGKVDRYNPYPCASCRLDKTNTVLEPDGSQRRYRFGVEYALNDGRQLQTDTLIAGGSAIRTQTDEYLSESAATSQPFYPQYGDILAGVGDPAAAYIRPVVQSQISQDGATFTTTTNSFDDFARAQNVTESSSLGYSRSVLNTYFDYPNLWVLGQPDRRIVNGIVADQYDYYSNTALEAHHWTFGKLISTKIWYADGTLHTLTNGNDRTTTFGNWYRGIPRSILYPDHTGITAGVNDDGWITAIVDENNFTTNYSYDPMGRLASITYPTGDDVDWNPTLLSFAPMTTSKYGIPAGNWEQTIHTGNGYAVTYFDALWRPLVTERFDNSSGSVKAATLSQTVHRYDVDGRTIFTSYPINNLGSYTTVDKGFHTDYDALNRVTEVDQNSEFDPDILRTTTEYLLGFSTKVTKPRQQGTGIGTVTSYRAYGQPTTQWPASITAPEGQRTIIDRDAFGKPLSVKRSGSSGGYSVSATRWFVYDGNQLLCKRIEPETNATLFSYDGANNVIWSAPGTSLTGNTCDRGSVATSHKIVREYDSRNRLIRITYPDGISKTTFTYAADGAMTSAINTTGDGAVETDYGYDMRRLLTSERLTVPGAGTFSIGYVHDTNGHLWSLSYPDVRTLNFAPNALGQPTQAGSYATSVSYFPNGAIKRFNYGDGSVHMLSQNPRQLPERSRDSSGAGAVLDNSYDYDENGNVAAITDALPGNVGSVYPMEYDRLDRLTAATSPVFAGTHQASFAYDPLDNLRTAKVGNGNQYNYSYDPGTNLLTSMTGSQTFDFGYDTRGNITRSNAQVYTFDLADRLRAANGLESYLYDAAGRRVRKSNLLSGTMTYYDYDKSGLLLHEWDLGAEKARDYVYLGGSLVAKVTKDKSPPPPPPAAPTSIDVPASSYSPSIPVSWSPSATATSYVLQQSANGGSWDQVYSGTATSRTVTVSATGSYTYRVKACNDGGCSGYRTSGAVAVTLKPASAPNLSGPSSSSSGTFTLNWSAVDGATRYQLNESINDGAWHSVYNGTSRSWTSSSLGNSTYAYRAYGWDEAGFGPASNQVTVTVIHVPAVPASISVPASSYSPSIPVSWSPSATATSYVLQQSANAGSWGQVYSGTATARTVTVSATGSYQYRVKACNTGGCSGYRTSGAVAVTLPPASAPSLSASTTFSNTGTFTMTWTGVTGATRYQLNQRINSGAWTVVYNGTGRSWSSSGLGHGTYAYKAYGWNAAGFGPASNQVTVSVLYPPAWVRAPLLATVNKPFTVRWDASDGASRYELRQTNLDNGSATTAYSGSATSTSITLSGPVGADFQYAARACNGAGCSAWTICPHPTELQNAGIPRAVPASGSSGP